VVENIVEINPWLAQRLPQVDMRVEYLSRDAVGRLIAAADADKYRHGPVLAVAIRLAVYAGLRASEAWGLMWSSVDFDRNVITIKNGYRDTPTKSRRDRVIPIADQLRDVLLDWRQRCPSQDHVCPVFSSSAGKWIACRRRPIIDRLYRTAGLPVPRAPWHVLRHTFASHFLMSGGSLLTLQRILGHTTIAITQIYSHLSDDHVASEMKRLKL
jgi:integrase